MATHFDAIDNDRRCLRGSGELAPCLYLAAAIVWMRKMTVRPSMFAVPSDSA
jgi:hypothetical protein